MRGGAGRWGSLLLFAALALNACGDNTAEPPASSPSSPVTTGEASTSSTALQESTTTEGGQGQEDLVIREMTEDEWTQFSALEDDSMVCPEPNMKAGDAFWDYPGDFDPSEYGRHPSDALSDAVTEVNDDYLRDTGLSEGFLPRTGWVGLTHEDSNTIYFVYPEAAWQNIITVSGDASNGAWRHEKATVCAPIS